MSYVLALFTREIAAAIKAQTKAVVAYGDEGFGRVVESGPHVQVLEDASGDAYDLAPTTQGGSDPARYRKGTGVLVRIKGASSKPGAKLADHRGVVEALADLFIVTALEIAHSHKQNIRSVSGGVVDDETNEIGANPASAEYQLRFQYVRAINKARAIAQLEDLVVGSAVIAHRLVIPTTDGASITAVAGGGVTTVAGLSGIDDSFVGKTLTLTGGANAGNAGAFAITSVIDSTSVQITNTSASLDTGLSWSVSDDEPAQQN